MNEPQTAYYPAWNIGEWRLFESGLEQVILGAAAVFWLGRSWYLSRQLIKAREKLERLLERFPGIRESLSETDPGARQGRHDFQKREHLSKGSMR